jgi:hypothetical protein
MDFINLAAQSAANVAVSNIVAAFGQELTQDSTKTSKFFVGREKELRNLHTFVSSRERIVALSGKRGVGITSLIVALGEELKNNGKSFKYYTYREFETLTTELVVQKIKLNKENVVVIDDFDVLPLELRLAIIEHAQINEANQTVIISSNKHLGFDSRIPTMTIHPFDSETMRSLLLKRAASITNKDLANKAVDFILNHKTLVNALSGNQTTIIFYLLRQLLNSIDLNSFQQNEFSIPELNDHAASPEDQEAAPSKDYIGYILAIILFFASINFGSESEKEIKKEIEVLQSRVDKYIEQNEKRPIYFVTVTYLKFRTEPDSSLNNSPFTIAPNTLIVVTECKDGWCKVVLKDRKDDTTHIGWVSQMYIEPLDD